MIENPITNQREAILENGRSGDKSEAETQREM